VPRQLIVLAGTKPKLDEQGKPVKDASGNAITEPITFHTDYIGAGKSQVLTITMPTPGQFEYRAQAGDNVDVIKGTVLVP